MKKKIAALLVLCLLAAALTCVSAVAETETKISVGTTVAMMPGLKITEVVPNMSTTEHCTLTAWKWYHCVDNWYSDLSQPVQEGEVFTAGETYVLYLEIKVDEGYRIGSHTINGGRASGYNGQPKDSDTFKAYYLLTPPTTAENIEASVNTPVGGNTPGKPEAALDTYYHNHICTVKSYTWYVLDGETKTPMTSGQKFEKDKHYFLEITFETTLQSLAIDADTTATLNGNIKASSINVLTLNSLKAEFDMGVANTTRLVKFDATVKEPTVGQKLDYSPSITLDPQASADCTVEWYISNGRYDDPVKITDKDALVVADRYYHIAVTLTAKEGTALDLSFDDIINGDSSQYYYDEKVMNQDGTVTVWREFATYAPYEITFTKKVELGGTASPKGKHTFEFDTFSFAEKTTAEVTTNGAGTFEGKIKLYGDADTIENALEDGIFIREKAADETGWTYDTRTFYICKKDGKLVAYCFPYDEEDYDEEYDPEVNGPFDSVEFVNVYTSNEPEESETTPTDPGAPATDDGSNIALFAALLMLSAAFAGVCLCKKRIG